TGDARREVEDLRAIVRLPEAGRRAMASLGALEQEHETLRNRARYADAERVGRDALEICRRWMGADHPSTAVSSSVLGMDLWFQHKNVEGEALVREALAIWLKALGADHPAVAVGYDDLAVILVAQGQYAEGERLHRQALDLRVRLLGPD